MKKTLFIGLFCLLSYTVLATNYYVAQNDPNASDANDGMSESSPFLTIQAAADVAQAGDVVLIKEGTYRETVVPANSGSAGSPIVFKPYSETESVTVSGAEVITGWQQESGNIYKAPMSYPFVEYIQGSTDQIFVDGQMMLLARWPNISPDRISYPKKALTTDAVRNTLISGDYPDALYEGVLTSETNPPQIDYSGGEILFAPDTGRWSWVLSGDLTSVSGNTIKFETINGSTTNRNGDYYENSRYILTNAFGLLDIPGEWYHDRDAGELYLWGPNSEDLTDHNVVVEAKKRDYAFDLSEKSYIEIKDIKLFAATVTTDILAGIYKGGYNPDGSFMDYHYPWRDKISVAPAHHITLDGLHVVYPSHSTNQKGHFYMQFGQHSGLVVAGTDHVVKNCHIQYSSSNGISSTGYRHQIINNLFEDICYYAGGYAAIGFGKSGAVSLDHEIAYNTVRRTGRSGILFRGLANSDPANLVTRIHHNDVSEYMIQDNDGGGVYAGGTDHKFIRIDHNYFHDGNNAYVNAGIYFDYCKNYIIDHNIVTGGWATIQLQHEFKAQGVNNAWVYNNTLVTSNSTPDPYVHGPFIFKGAGDKSDVVIQNNIAVYSEPPSKNNYRLWDSWNPDVLENNFMDAPVEDADLVNYPNDLTLSSNSSMIDQGSVIADRDFADDGNTYTIPAYNDPYDGSAPDIGAIEFGEPMFHVGVGDTMYNITVASNNGTTNISPGAEYPGGATLVLRANGNTGYVFSHWSGDLSGSENPTNIILDGEKNITANFVDVQTLQFTLTTSAINGSITLDPSGGVYYNGTSVTATAIANEGYVFTKWTGASTATDNNVEIIMDEDKSLTAVFDVDTTTNISSFNKLAQGSISIYPNPTKSNTNFFIKLKDFKNSGEVNIQVQDLSGRVWLSQMTQVRIGIDPKINIPSLNKGIYLVTVKSKNEIANLRLIIK